MDNELFMKKIKIKKIIIYDQCKLVIEAWLHKRRKMYVSKTFVKKYFSPFLQGNVGFQ